MTKQDFLSCLHAALGGLPQETIDEQLAFYSEMIDDRTEDGIAEDVAVAELGDAATLAQKIIADTPLTTLVKESVKQKRRLAAWESVLLIVGSPVWLSVLIAAFAVIISLYVSLWAIILSLWAMFASFIGCTVGAMITGIVFICLGNTFAGIAMIGAALVLAGFSIFAFFGCKAATSGTVSLTKIMVHSIKRCFVKKEGAR